MIYRSIIFHGFFISGDAVALQTFDSKNTDNAAAPGRVAAEEKTP